MAYMVERSLNIYKSFEVLCSNLLPPTPPPPIVTIKFWRDTAHLSLGSEHGHIKEGIPNISHECTLCKVGGKKLMASRLKYVLSTVIINADLSHRAPLTFAQRIGKHLALKRRGGEVKNKVS